MAFTSDGASTRKTTRSVDLGWDSGELGEQKQPRDWKKLFLVIGLGVLSWVATYVGMLELIEANMGELPLVHKAIIGFSVAMLMVMVVWLLDEMFSDNGFITKCLYAAGYVFLTVISVGFGFGFYWKVLESRSEASRSAESAIAQVQTSLHGAMTRLEQLQSTLDGLTNVSTQKSDVERQTGASCPNSKPGDGPRRKMRDDDAGRFKFASDFVKGRVSTVKSDIAALEADLSRIVKDDKSTVDAKSGTRNEFMKNVGRKLDMTVVGFNAFRTDPQLKQIRVDLNERSDKVTFVDTKGGTYTCPDSQLTTALKGVVRAIDELPALEKPKIAAVEGSEAVIEAFRRLTATFYGALSFKMPPSPEELRELQKKAVQSAEVSSAQQAKLNAMADQAGLSKRDYVPLAIAIFVDLCLLLVSMKKGGKGRLGNLVTKMRAAEQGPVIQILSRFNEIHRDKDIRENFEVFRHVVFDFHGDYYAAVPLNTPYRPNPRNGDQRQGYGVSDAEALMQQAHLLANLFASFEKEKIFTRVYSPLLSTKTIQKRLRRQGSKFANAEAFRIYRFRDGAWSEIILGAVMGAARRVEAEKRRRRVEEEIFDEMAPTLDRRGPERAPVREPLDADAGREPLRVRPETAQPYVVGGTEAPAPRHMLEIDAEPDAPPPPAPKYSMSRAPQSWPRPVTSASAAAESAGTRHANSNTAPERRAAEPAMPFPAPAATLAPQPTPAENVVLHPAVARPTAANSGMAAAGAAIAQSYVHPQAPTNNGNLAIAHEPFGDAAKEPTVTVAATRETLTYTLPVSEAALPHSLLKVIAGGRTEAEVMPALAAATVEPIAEAFAPIHALSAPLPVIVPSIPAALSADVIALPEAKAELEIRAEQTAWSEAHDQGFASEQAEALETPIAEHELRTIAMRLRPERREG